MALFDTTGFRILEQGMSIVNQSQSVIANNIANQDTPGYKCQYVLFSGVLEDKLNATKETVYKKQLNLYSTVYTDNTTNDQADGNNVDTDTQEALFAKNALLYEALINQMNSEFNLMRTAMSRT